MTDAKIFRPDFGGPKKETPEPTLEERIAALREAEDKVWEEVSELRRQGKDSQAVTKAFYAAHLKVQREDLESQLPQPE